MVFFSDEIFCTYCGEITFQKKWLVGLWYNNQARHHCRRCGATVCGNCSQRRDPGDPETRFCNRNYDHQCNYRYLVTLENQ